MGDASVACCVCDAPNGKHCTKCKSRHYCSKACQLVDWKGGHKAQCRQLAAEFQDRLLDELMPAKLKIKEEPAIVADVAPAAGFKAAARLPAVWTAKAGEAGAVKDGTPAWRGTCAICLDLLPSDVVAQAFHSCCCQTTCMICSEKCQQHDTRCPLCRMPAHWSDAELVRRLQTHVDKGHAEAQELLGSAYSSGSHGLKNNLKRAVELYKLSAAQGHAPAQAHLGLCYERGDGVKIDYKTAVRWYRLAAEQGYPAAQSNLGYMYDRGWGVAKSDDEAVKWYQLAAAQGYPDAFYCLSWCYAEGRGVPQGHAAALRCAEIALAKGHSTAKALVHELCAMRDPAWTPSGRGPA